MSDPIPLIFDEATFIPGVILPWKKGWFKHV